MQIRTDGDAAPFVGASHEPVEPFGGVGPDGEQADVVDDEVGAQAAGDGFAERGPGSDASGTAATPVSSTYEGRIGLAEAVRRVRAELVAAMREGQDAELRFRTGPVELEFTVEAGRETSAGGEVRWWVVRFRDEPGSRGFNRGRRRPYRRNGRLPAGSGGPFGRAG